MHRIIQGFEDMALAAIEAAGSLKVSSILKWMGVEQNPDLAKASRFAEMLEEHFLQKPVQEMDTGSFVMLSEIMEATFSLCDRATQITTDTFKERLAEIISGLRHPTTSGKKCRTVAFYFCLSFYNSLIEYRITKQQVS